MYNNGIISKIYTVHYLNHSLCFSLINECYTFWKMKLATVEPSQSKSCNDINSTLHTNGLWRNIMHTEPINWILQCKYICHCLFYIKIYLEMFLHLRWGQKCAESACNVNYYKAISIHVQFLNPQKFTVYLSLCPTQN